MRNVFLTSLVVLSVFFSSANAQTPAPLSIAFVSSRAVLAAHPAGQEAARLTEQARTELQSIATALQPLQARANAGETLSAEEQNNLELSQRTYQETQQRYQGEIEAAAQPASVEINTIIQGIAQENGYTLVLDFDVAQTSGLVVYAAQDSVPNITQEVVTAIEAAYPGAAGSSGSGGGN